MTESRYGLHILLPEILDRRFAHWANETPGASWPEWGGHITLLASFISRVPEHELIAAIGAVIDDHHVIDVHLTQLAVVQDLTREGYRAVFLTTPAQTRSGLLRLKALQGELNEATLALRTDRFPDMARREYLPHLTLALGLSEHEAHQMVSAARSGGLVAEFYVDRVWLFCLDDGLPVRRIPFQLSSPLPLA